jgi:pyridoxamine 5'-phosphate oxidase
VSLEFSRKSYDVGVLDESMLGSDPLAALRRWVDEAYAAPSHGEPNAMCLATVGSDGAPSARIVLLRGLDERGLVFYTSYFSRKGRELDNNPRVAAVLYWPALHRQARVEGSISQLSEDESEAYFASRPRGNQLSAWASEQSEHIGDRETLDERMLHFDRRFEGEEVPRPHSWGGYLIAPVRIEFWQGRPNRMHDRLEFVRKDLAWTVRRLQP